MDGPPACLHTPKPIMPFAKLNYWLIAGMLLPLVLLVLALINPDAPDYEVIERGDGFQLREYAPMRVAETRVQADFDAVDAAAYPQLLDYVRGRNALGRKVPMLAPAMFQRVAGGDGDDWLVGFVMAKEYPMYMLPPPGTDAVSLRQLPAELIAARRFGGGWGQARWEAQADELLRSVERAGLRPVGEPVFARYNAPFVPGFLRRNEVLLSVER